MESRLTGESFPVDAVWVKQLNACKMYGYSSRIFSCKGKMGKIHFDECTKSFVGSFKDGRT